MKDTPRGLRRMAGAVRFRPGAVVAAAILLLTLSLAVQLGAAFATHSTSTIGLVALDPATEGNAATSLGPINGCSRLEPDGQINVDYVVDSIPEDRPMIGFEAEIRYDAALLEVAQVDFNFLLAAVGSHSPFPGRTDQLPDSDGGFRMSILDTASSTDPEANVERGAGVLARITFRAKAAGVSELAITVSQDPLVYPVVLDTQNELILVDRTGKASLAIGQDCPVEVEEPQIIDITQTNEEIIAANPELQGGGVTPIGGATTQPGTTPEGDTPEGQTPEGETPTPEPSPTTVPCAAPPPPVVATPAPSATSPTPPPSPTDSPSPSPSPAEVVCTPTPPPIEEQIVAVDDDSNTALLVGAAALLTAGAATAGGGWFIYRRSRDTEPAV